MPQLKNVTSGTSIACNLRSAKLFFVPELDFSCYSWARSAGRCTGAAQAQQLRELMVRGSAAGAPESDASTRTEMWIYELTFILVSPAAWSSGTENTPSS